MVGDRSIPWPLVAGGFVLLAVAPLSLSGVGVLGTFHPGGVVVLGVFVLGGMVAAGVGIRYEWWEVRRIIRDGWVVIPDADRKLVAVVVGALLTLGGVMEIGLSPIVAAGLVGVLAALVTPAVAVPVYCGAFVGMTSPALFGSYWFSVLAAILAGLLFVVAHPVFTGIGGKLGTTAFIGVLLVVLPTSSSFQSGPLPGGTDVLVVVLAATLGAVTTFVLHTRSPATPVLASGLVGVLAGQGIPAFVEPGGLVAAAVYAASFAGMTDPRRIPSEWWVGLSGTGVGLVVVYTTPYLGGSGGKLGTIAFGSCLGIHGVLRAVGSFQLARRGYRKPETETT